MSKIIDAVSIVMTCEDELFAIQRQNYLNAFPGYWAFPGGKVEIGDDSYSTDHDALKNIDKRLFGAVVREGKEELGIDLREEIKSGRVKSVDFLGLAVTPDFNPYRFATYFFKINFTHKVDMVVDTNEAQTAKWISGKKLLEEFHNGHVLAVPPVVKVIETLGNNPQAQTIPDLNFDYDGNEYVPYIENIFGVKQLMPLSHTLPPATRTNAFLIGDEKRVIIDPSPRDDEEYRKFKNTLGLWGAQKIFITHHHPDHYQYSNRLARELGIPLMISQDTRERISRKDPLFFNDVTVEIASEGTVVTTWLGKEVLVMEVPGHDEGQLALYPSDRSWFIAGDLFQGIGTVVIGGEEGDMQKYFDTLERIIKLSPKVVFPSHGIGLGGTNILQKTLTHRKEREAQVLELSQKGLTPEQMLSHIYSEVRKDLWPYALENIHKHLQKLKNEGALKL